MGFGAGRPSIRPVRRGEEDGDDVVEGVDADHDSEAAEDVDGPEVEAGGEVEADPPAREPPGRVPKIVMRPIGLPRFIWAPHLSTITTT